MSPIRRGPGRFGRAARPTAVAAPELGLARGEALLRRLELTVRRRLDGMLQGDHLGLLPGPGSELAEARLYVPGQDDVRRIDWYATARLGEPYVRDTVADHELESWAVVDLTASMDFGTALCEKRDLAVAAVASIGFLACRGGNRLGAYMVSAGGVRMLPARSGRPALYGLLGALTRSERAEPSAEARPSLVNGLSRLSRHQHRGVRLVVSDFLDTPTDGSAPDWEQPVRRLARRHHVLVVEVVDPRELELPDVGMLTVVDPETGRRREVSTSSRRLRERYASAAAEQRAAVAAAVGRTGAAHLILRTDRDWVLDVARFAEGQRRRQARAGGQPPRGPAAHSGAVPAATAQATAVATATAAATADRRTLPLGGPA